MKRKAGKIMSFILFLIGLSNWVSAQTNINMSNGTSTTCSGNFYDSGGSGGNYGNSETYTFTICSNVAGQSPYLTFSSFNIESTYDHLYIYDGNNTSFPLIGSWTGSTSPGTVAGSGSCITIVFTSDGSVNYAGWAATISCGSPAAPPPSAPGTCATADPFCTGTTYTFPASQNTTAESGPAYGCLLSQPNPAWYYLQVANSGNLVIAIAGTGGYDVDYICWGPFTSPTAPCTAQLSATNTVSCSYSTSSTETCTIPSGVTGQYYMLLITNFSNQAQNITFNQAGGTGSTNCSIVCPTPTVSPITICKGNSGTLTALGGSTSYSWSPSTGLSSTTGSVVTASPTVTTTYSVVGTGTCTSSPVAVTVSVVATPTVTVNSPTICKGSSTTLTASGATTYSWSPSTGLSATTGASVTANPTVTTTYTIVGTSGTCTSSVTSIVTVNPQPTVTVNSPTVCPGGSVNLTAAGASTYAWNTGSTANPLSVTPGATSYTVTGTSAAGCTNTAVSTVTIVTPPAVTVNSPTVCNGSSVNLTAAGASTYTWNTGSTANPLNVTPGATSYTVTGTSAGGCTNTAVSTVTVVAKPTVTVNSPTVCIGSSVSITAAGASTYTWNTGSTANPLSVTPGATSYTVTGTSATGCTNTAVSTVTVVPNPTITVASVTICPGASSALSASGGSTYTWAPASSLSSSTGTSVTASPTVNTTYTITGTSAGGCTATTTASVTIGGGITPTVASATICAGSSATLNASGGTTFTWSPGTGLSATTGASVTANPTVTTTYTITAASGACTGSTTAVVTVNPMPTVSVNSPSMCINATTTLTANGASSYSWSPATGLSSSTGANPVANPTVTTTYTVVGTTATCTGVATSTVTINPLPPVTASSSTVCPGTSATITAGGASTYTWNTGATTASISASPPSTTNYTVTGTDANGCVNTATTSITVLSAIVTTVNSATACAGSPATLTANGAGTYSWSPATGLSSTSGTTVTATPASTTVYTVTGSAGTCSATATSTVTINPLPTVTASSGTICVGQTTATLTAGGASSYAWSPSTGLSTSTGASVTANPTITTSYTVTGTDANGCVNTNTTTVTVNPQPTVTVNNATYCTGGSAVLTATGASTYTWSPATGLSATTGASVTASPTVTTDYTITATSAAGCVGTATTNVSVVTTPTITANTATLCIGDSATLAANGAVTYTWSPGTGLNTTSGASVTANPSSTTVYTISGTAGTCTAVATTTVTVNPLPVVTVNSSTICIGQQTATLTANGASTYSWDPSTGLSSASGTSVTGTPTTTTSYTVTGTDVNGCVSTATTAITVNPLPTVTLNNGFICNGSTVTLNAGGASGYAWSPSTGLSATTGSSVDASPASTTQYTVTGTDANGCINSDTTSVTVVSNPTVTVASATICVNDVTTLTASGAVTYVWAPGTGLNSTTNPSVTANPTTTTVYTITGTAGSCTAVTTATITVNPLPVVTVNTATICAGQQTATLTAGGASSYAWSPATGLSSASGSPVTATPSVTTGYTVTGTDANGCINTNTTTVTVNQLPFVTLTPGFICAGNSTTLIAGGAVTYSWMPGTGLSSTTGSNVTANPSTTTLYTVVGIDANGCINGDTATLTVMANPVITVASSTICAGNNTTLSASGATTYTWSPVTALSSTSSGTVVANPLVTTVYTIDGAVGTCTTTTTVTVTVNQLPVIVIGSNSPVCVNQALNLTSSGGTNYTWSGPNSFSSTLQNPSITGITFAAYGTYSLTVVDANSCVNTATVDVVVNPLPTVTVAGSTVCINQTISLTSAGGVGYSWSGPLGYASNQQNPTIPNATAGMAGNYVVTVTDANNCVNANVAQVSLNPLPVVSATSGTVCAGSTVQLNASGANSYNWFPTTGLSSSTSASVSATVNTTTTFTIVGTDLNGCRDTATTVVTINPLPVLSITPSIAGGCMPVCVSYSNTTSATGFCEWNFGDGNIITNDCNPTHCFTSIGKNVVTLTLTDANNCKNTANAITNVYPIPVADFSFDPQPTTVLDPVIHFTNQTTGASITGFNWTMSEPPNTYTAVSSSPSHTYMEAGSYPVELVVTSNYGCKDSITKVVVIGEDYFIYVPNAFTPNMDGVNDLFFAKGEGIKDFKMYIFDRWGNEVFFTDDILKGWDGRYMGKGETILQEDVYVWKIVLHTFRKEEKMLKGTVSLLK
ncbi:MAG: T9SS type B sorting domain-containing protein [Bacteroidia bacterium]